MEVVPIETSEPAVQLDIDGVVLFKYVSTGERSQSVLLMQILLAISERGETVWLILKQLQYQALAVQTNVRTVVWELESRDAMVLNDRQQEACKTKRI